MKRWLKTFLIVAVIIGIPAAWLLISHLIAKRALEKYKAQLRAAGEKLTIEDLQPSPVPPDQTGAKLVARAYYLIHDAPSPYPGHLGPIETNPPPAMTMVAPGKAAIGWRQPEIVSDENELKVRSTNSWLDIGQELKIRFQAIDLLHQASALSRIDVRTNYDDISDRNADVGVTMEEEAALFLWTATLFDLHRGDTASAAANIHATLALMNALNSSAEPYLESQIWRMIRVPTTAQVQWEVLQATNLTDAELALLQRDWESMDCVRHFERALEMERAWDEVTSQGLRSSNSPPISGMHGIPGIGEVTRRISRRASDILWRVSWSYGDELRVLRRDQVTIDCVRELETNSCFKDAIAERDHKLSAIPVDDTTNNWLRGHLEDQLATVLWNSADRVDDGGVNELLVVEAIRRITMTAIALKRYQIRHRAWPADLKTLVPEFLSEVPRDPVDGLPLRYRPNSDGTFTLYSVGNNGSDVGGDATAATDPGDSNWLHGRDWVWPQPVTTSEPRQFQNELHR